MTITHNMPPAGSGHKERGACTELRWWQGHSRLAVLAVALIVVVSAAPFFAGYALAPPGRQFSGALTYPQDDAQHETWASQMALHFWYRNLLTPEPSSTGWFVSPIELSLGLAQRASGVPYPLLRHGVGVA